MYDRPMIQGITEHSKPLYDLIHRTKTKITWDAENIEHFEQLKGKWGENIECFMPDMGKEFELEVDASLIGIGAVLRQNGNPFSCVQRVVGLSD